MRPDLLAPDHASLPRRTPVPVTTARSAWRGATAGLGAGYGAVLAAFFAIQILRDFNAGKLVGFGALAAAALAFGALGLGLHHLLSRLAAPFRRLLFLGGPLTIAALAWYLGPPAMLLAAWLLALASAAGAAVAHRRRVALALTAVLFASTFAVVWSPRGPANPFLPERLDDRTLALPNPGLPGSWGVRVLTYGPGAELPAGSVNGAALIRNWDGVAGSLRTRYWGFGPSALPVQGRLWAPEGDGPFPVVVMVHGDHAMEEVGSVGGYDYLGRLLASRGCLFVSVDEGFLNTSLADMTDLLGGEKPGLHGNNDARAWLMLEHLAQLRRWNAEMGHPLFGKVDLGRVIVGGHSVGGEAAALAALFNRLGRYPNDARVRFDYGFGIQGVLGVAPGAEYLPRGTATELTDVSYLALQGSLDAQATSFQGSAQYSRVKLGPDARRFKAALYVVGANHDQFNTAWGRIDIPDFWGWAVDPRALLSAQDQRRVAEVFVGAFAEVVLHGRDAYRPVFEDARAAAGWLPPTYTLTRFTAAEDRAIADFEEDADPQTTSHGGPIDAEGLSRWEELSPKLKKGSLDTHVVALAWEPGAAVAHLDVALGLDSPRSGSALVLSLAAGDNVTQPLDFSLVLTDAAGAVATVPVSADQPVYPQLQTPTRRRLLEHRPTREPLLRRHRYPWALFTRANPAFDPRTLRAISLRFDRSPSGEILIDDVGVSR